MRIAFYYQNWDDVAISGTQDAINVLMTELKRRYGYECLVFNGFTQNIGDFNKCDVVIFLSSVTSFRSDVSLRGVDIDKIETPKVLWNHCWDFVEGTEDILDKFDLVMGLSEKHAKHLGIDEWCYNGINHGIFERKFIPTLQPMPKVRNRVLYCGGPAWWKGGKKIPAIKKTLSENGYELREVWNITQHMLCNEFNEAQFVIIPSEIESFCLVSVQAQACGCVPIAHDVGGISETMPFKYLLYDEDYIAAIKKAEEENRNGNLEACCMYNTKRFDIEETANKFHLMMNYI